MLRKLRRESSISLFGLWLVTIGLIVPPQAWAGEVAAATAAPSAPQPDTGTAYVLQPNDNPYVVAKGLAKRARKLGLTVVQVSVVRGPEDDPRIDIVNRELKLDGFTLETNILNLSDGEEMVEAMADTLISSDELRASVEKVGQDQGVQAVYDNSALARFLRTPGKVLRAGETVLSGIPQLFRWCLGKASGQKPRTVASFVLDPEASERGEVQLKPIRSSVVKTALYTAVLAGLALWGTYWFGPMLSNSDRFKFDKLSDSGYHGDWHVAFIVVGWVFASLALTGPLTAWKDQILKRVWDESAPKGQQIQYRPNGFANFGLSMVIETIFNVMFPIVTTTINALNPNTVSAWELITDLGTKLVMAPYIALFSVFSFVVPNNLFGRWINKATELSNSEDPKDLALADRYSLLVNWGMFVFWSVIFSAAVNAARFLPNDKPSGELLPDALQFLAPFVSWIPANQVPLVFLGTLGFAWQYGRSTVNMVYQGIRKGIRRLWGERYRAPEPVRYERSCAVFLLKKKEDPKKAAPKAVPMGDELPEAAITL